MKECFRNWVLTHEKLYKAIVFLIALVAFLAVTAHGCKTVKAEAATEKFIWTGFETSREAILRECPYVVQMREWQGNGWYYFFSDNTRGFVNTNYDLDINYSVFVDNGYNVRNVTSRDTYQISSYDFQYLVGSNYDYRGVYGVSVPINNIEYPIYEAPVPQYSVNAPYVVGKNVNLQNPYLQGVLPYGDALKKSYLELECNMLGDYQLYDEFTVRGILSVNLPTRDFFEAFVKGLSSSGNYDFDDIDTVVLTSKAAIEYVKAWRSQTKNCVTYHLPFEYTYSLDEIVEGKLYIKFNAKQVFNAIAEDSGSTLRSMYCPDDITDLQYTVVFEPLMSGFLDYFELGAYTVSHNDSLSVYGKYVAHAFGGPDNTTLTTYVSDLDVENTPSDEFTESVQGGLGDATQEYVENLEATIKDLQGRLEQINNDLAAMEGGLDGSALWNGFNSVVLGIRSVGDSVRGVAVVIGNVFSFIPGPITAIMSFTLVAMCVIGIYKALKG